MIRPAAARLATRVPAGFARAAAAVVTAALVASLAAAPVATAQPGGPGGPGGGGGARDGTSSTKAPLAVSIDTLTPSTVPRRGNVTVTGQITNRSDSTWTDLNVYLFASSEPITTSDELAAATATNESQEVGDRVTREGLYAKVADLEPGESTDYRLSVPSKDLPFRGPGVYWLGVHVLGTDDQGRVPGADGRARTFIASMAGRRPPTTLSLVVPLRGAVRRAPDGRLADVEAWERRFATDGRLARLVSLTSTGADVPVTWVVDPAVLEAARSIAQGNPPFDIEPTGSGSGQESKSPSPSPSSPLTDAPQTDSGDSQGAGEDLSELSAEAQDASTWLDDFKALATTQTVLSLPYGDVDTAALLRGGYTGTFARANELSRLSMDELGIDDKPVVAPADGLLPTPALERLDPTTALLLSEQAAPRTRSTMVRPLKGPDAVLSSDAARIGGPTPTPAFDALALRQRILAEAAVHGLTGVSETPLVVSTPDLWDPGSQWQLASFFSGLNVPWIHTVDLPMASALSITQDYPRHFAYSRASRRQEIPAENLIATRELSAAGSVLADLLSRNDTIDAQVGRAAMLGSSTEARRYPHQALSMTRRLNEAVHAQIGKVYVEGSPLVTMSSETGNFSVTVVNGLDEPVQVGIDAQTGTDELKIRAPNLVSLGPGQRASVRLAVKATGTGIHSVRIVPTTKSGHPLDRVTRIKVRSSQVGLVIWVIMGTGAAVFVVAIGARILRRVRDRRRTHAPELEDVTS